MITRMPKLPNSAYSAMAPVPGKGWGNRRTTNPIAFFEKATLLVVTGELPVLVMNYDRNTKKSLIFPTDPSTSARSPASPAVWNSLKRVICRNCP